MNNRHNGAGGPTMTKKRGMKTNYSGNARFIEIGSKGVPFRYTVNIDHIDAIRFEEMFDEQEVPVPGGTITAAVLDDAGKVIMPELSAPTEKRVISVGWHVVVSCQGRENAINFRDVESAMSCYNHVLAMIRAVGVPTVTMAMLQPPEKSSSIVGVDGEAIKEAVDAVDLHPNLAGGDGIGIAENDDVDFTLTEEDLAMLENPEFDINIEEEIEEQVLKDTLAKDPEDPPATN